MILLSHCIDKQADISDQKDKQEKDEKSKTKTFFLNKDFQEQVTQFRNQIQL